MSSTFGGGIMRKSWARNLLLAGVVGPPLFVAVFLVDGLIHPAYNPVTDYVSELSRGELGWLQVANFIVFGAAMLAFAAGILWGASRGPGSIAGATLFALVGICLLLAGIFTTDSRTAGVHTISGTIHNLVSQPVFLGVIAVAFVFSRRFSGPMGVYSLLTGGAMLVFFLSIERVGARLGIIGIVQRATIVVGWTWISVLALALRSEASRRSTVRATLRLR